jgi:hypothetical protein
MKIRFLLLSVIILILACQVIPTPPPLKNTPPSRITPESAETENAPEIQSTPVDNSPTDAPAVLAPGEMPTFPYQKNEPFSSVEITDWQPTIIPDNFPSLPINLEQTENLDVISGLTNSQRDFLKKNGFVVIHNRDNHFADIRASVSTYNGQPYFLTSDAAFHALHLANNELLVTLEKEILYPRMKIVVQSTLDEILSYYPLVQGTNLEADTHLATAYLGVALKLLDPQSSLEPYLDQQVSAQVEQIMNSAVFEESVLFPFFKDDFGEYQPVDHYIGDPELEAYFRAMSWLGRVNFNHQLGNPNFNPTRIPVIVTLALRRASIDGEPAANQWALVHEILSFLTGSCIGSGPAEYAERMDQVYGPGLTIVSLKDEANWQAFLSLSQNLAQPQENNSFPETLKALGAERGWRFMGRRFSPDIFIMQNLIYEKVGTQENPRLLPSGLDIMASLGSQAAAQYLESSEETEYENYVEQMERLNNAITPLSPSQWLQDAFSSWLYAFLPLLEEKGDNYPDYMQTNSWAYKDLNSTLGSWAEIRHDAPINLLDIETITDSSNPASGPAPGYIEPNPQVFYRLSYIAIAISDGLSQRLSLGTENEEEIDLVQLINEVQELGVRYQQLGDIAAKQLEGIPLDQNDFLLIQSHIGKWDQALTQASRLQEQGINNQSESPPIKVISLVEGANEEILQIGTGSLDRIYVVVPISDQLHIAQGGVYSFYEFAWQRDELITDFKWRQMLDYSPPERPKWTENFALPDGHPVEVLEFRIGDIYKITPTGVKLNMRAEPSLSAPSMWKLQPGEYVEITDGPAEAEGFTWWKFKLVDTTENPVEGWAVENSDWYDRAWGQ